MQEELLRECRLCPRECKVNRLAGEKGVCREDFRIMAARAALHFWEEPCISGTKGSGAVFFSGCSLGCVFCQNHEIAAAKCQREISEERLSEIFLELQQQGAANVNLVTAVQFVPQILAALDRAKKNGFSLPVLYNCSGYEKTDTLKLLEPYVDIYLPDFKYWEPKLSRKYAHAPDYAVYAKTAIAEMVRQTGPCVFDAEGYLRKGTLVRHLILPGNVANSKHILKYLIETYGTQIYISIMNQYTPLQKLSNFPELNRRVTRREYERVLSYALDLGLENGYLQEGKTASESFVPLFDFAGLQPQKNDNFQEENSY